jgi:predicted lipoprotein
VSVYPRVVVVEKRNPRVVPYLDIAAGNFADVTGEQALKDRGVRWVVL